MEFKQKYWWIFNIETEVKRNYFKVRTFELRLIKYALALRTPTITYRRAQNELLPFSTHELAVVDFPLGSTGLLSPTSGNKRNNLANGRASDRRTDNHTSHKRSNVISIQNSVQNRESSLVSAFARPKDAESRSGRRIRSNPTPPAFIRRLSSLQVVEGLCCVSCEQVQSQNDTVGALLLSMV